MSASSFVARSVDRVASGVLRWAPACSAAIGLALAFPASSTETPKTAAVKTAPKLSAEQILARNLAARGGLPAWNAVQAMTVTGRMEAGFGDSVSRSARYVSGATQPSNKKARAELLVASAPSLQAKQVELPFVLDLARPTKSRLELVFAGKTAVQVFDGTAGWKVRPFLNRRDVEDLSADELQSQQGEDEIGGPLMNVGTDGGKLAVEAVEAVEGHEAYKLRLTGRNGSVRHIWVDTQSFLDVKLEGAPRQMDGRLHAVAIYQRDFRSVQGLKIPFLMETVVDGYQDSHRIEIDKVAVNPKFDGAVFAKPKA